MMQFMTYRKRGRSWEQLTILTANSARSAALETSYVHNLKVVVVKTLDFGVIEMFRFNNPASITMGK